MSKMLPDLGAAVDAPETVDDGWEQSPDGLWLPMRALVAHGSAVLMTLDILGANLVAIGDERANRCALGTGLTCCCTWRTMGRRTWSLATWWRSQVTEWASGLRIRPGGSGRSGQLGLPAPHADGHSVLTCPDVPQDEPATVKPQAGRLVATQASRLARTERFSVTAPCPERDFASQCQLPEPERPPRLDDVAYAQVRRRTVKIRANF